MSSFAVWNGKVVQEENVLISPNNHSFRYGDGCFETMKVINGRILLQDFHFQRLFSSLYTLKFSVPTFLTDTWLSALILELLHANHHASSARVRLTVYRGNGGLYDVDDNLPQFIIQSFPATHGSDSFNERGLVTGIYPDAKKTTDKFSSVKSNNYLPYVMGAVYAKQNGLDDSFITNAFDRIADATIANIFVVANGVIKTPLLTEGCINGVMRRYLIQSFKAQNIPFMEAAITVPELLAASEVFLTNATYGIRWVQRVNDSHFSNETSIRLHHSFINPLFNSATF